MERLELTRIEPEEKLHILFTTDTNQAEWRPDIKLFDEQMKFRDGPMEKCPKFLGVILDRTLCFQDHVKAVTDRVNDRCKILFCLASRSWGGRSTT